MAKRREKQGCELRDVLLFAAKARVDSTDFHFSKKKNHVMATRRMVVGRAAVDSPVRGSR
jgi:hypothetical protein